MLLVCKLVPVYVLFSPSSFISVGGFDIVLSSSTERVYVMSCHAMPWYAYSIAQSTDQKVISLWICHIHTVPIRR